MRGMDAKERCDGLLQRRAVVMASWSITALQLCLFCSLISYQSFCYAFTLAPPIYLGAKNKMIFASRRRHQQLVLRSASEEEGNMMDEYERQSQAFRQQRSSEVDDNNSQPASASFPRRVKTRLNNLLSGMPSLSDMFRAAEEDESDGFADSLAGSLASSSRASSAAKDSSSDSPQKHRPQEIPNDAWFQEEKQQITLKYNAMLNEMQSQLQTQRQKDPEAIPENAEALMKYIFKEEMEKELVETRDRRAKERLKTYGAEKMEQLDRMDISQAEVTEDLQIILDETQDELERRIVARQEREDFAQYEKEAISRAVNDESIPTPADGTDMDLWALDRLEEMAASKSETDGAQEIVDILEESAERLRSRLKRESEKGPIRPESMKEWQMYRAIATRLAADDELLGTTGDNNNERDVEVQRRLDAWKAYVDKEDSIREEFGLTRGPKMPFDWHDAKMTREEDPIAMPENRTKTEIRKDINRMSIQALESLLTTVSSSRRESLTKEIAYMKSVLEPNDYLDIDEESLEREERKPKLTGPVDLRDVFSPPLPKRAAPAAEKVGSEATIAPRKDPVYASAVVLEDNDSRPPPPPPNTPFFSEDRFVGESAPVDTKLGDMEAQKLQAMFRKAGARSEAEQEKIRRQYEDYKRMEAEARLKSGLAGESDEALLEEPPVDVSAYLGDDGTIDTEKLLQSIGPRPSRSKKNNTQDTATSVAASVESSVNQEEVFESMFRSVSAVGGGRYKDDPAASAQMRTSYEEFVQKEKQLRHSMMEADASPLSTAEIQTDFDDVKYAESVLESLGPRPKVQRVDTLDEGAISDRGGILALESTGGDFDDDDEEDDDDDPVSDRGNEQGGDVNMPGWLRQERKDEAQRGIKGQLLNGGNIDDVFEDDQYDKRIRQLHEYEKRRGRRPQIGIDVADVLGRRGSDDYADYNFDDEDFRSRQGGDWGDISFKARKESLLDYIELDAVGLNSLMDHKDSVYSTGVSQYLPRINRPFSCFGAIFRLEGVLVDLTQLQMEAWTRVAEKFGFKEPEYDDVVRASVLRPDIALREAFFWTNDVILIRDAVVTHRKIFRELFDQWAKSQGVAPSKTSIRAADGLVIGVEVLESEAAINEEMIGSSMNSWLKTAEVHSKPLPSQADLFHAASLDPEGAVMEAFRWTSDPEEASRIVKTYSSCLKFGRSDKEDAEILPSQAPSPTVSAELHNPIAVATEVQKRVLDENTMMEIHFKAWRSVAETFQFTPPDSDAVLSAFVINDPAMVIGHIFGWTDDATLAEKIVVAFRQLVHSGVESFELGTSQKPEVSSEMNQPDAARMHPSDFALQSERIGESNPQTNAPGPSQDDVFRSAFDAWKAVALKLNKEPPKEEQVLFAMSVGPDSAVVSGFEWASDFNEAAPFVELYTQEVTALRQGWSSSSTSIEPTAPTAQPKEAKPLVYVAPGAAEWIKSLLEVEMSCATVSFLESDQVEALLSFAGLADLFPSENRVTMTSGYKDDIQQLLGAALRVERRPDHCVVFDTTPHASLAAHEIDMRSVSLIGNYPKYELLTSDSTTASFAQMTAMDIRRLFSERVFDQPQTESLQPIVGVGRKVATRTAFWEEE